MKTPLWLVRSGRGAQVWLAAAVLLVLLLLFYPFQTTIVPEWSFKVVTEEGAPVRDVNVTEHWQHFLLESSSHEEVRRIQENGAVSFPERTIRASLVRRGIATISRIKETAGGLDVPLQRRWWFGETKDYATTVAVYNRSELPLSHVIVPTIK